MSRPFRRRRLAPAALVAVLALTGTASAAVVGLPADGTQVNDDPAARIDPNQDAGVSDVAGGAVTAGKAQGAVGDVRAEGRRRRSRPSSARSRTALDDAGAPLAERRGTRRPRRLDRLRRRGTPVPWVAWYEPNAASPADEHLRQPFQRGGQRLAARWPGRAQPTPVAQHPHRSQRREPGGCGRCRRRGQRPGAVGRLAGEGRRRDDAARARSSLARR